GAGAEVLRAFGHDGFKPGAHGPGVEQGALQGEGKSCVSVRRWEDEESVEFDFCFAQEPGVWRVSRGRFTTEAQRAQRNAEKKNHRKGVEKRED
ncbi:MAG: hypothetical protein N3A66_12410, partial [Planctomycetota bacterium]|nr:hypothetical protein [Planctomycetota bacterium]